MLKSSKANDIISGTELDQCQHGDKSCQKPFKQMKTIEMFFKQTKIIKVKIKCAPKILSFNESKIRGSKILPIYNGYAFFHWVCPWLECYENKGFVKMKKHLNFLQEKHDVLNDLSWFGLNPSQIRNRQDLLKPTRGLKIRIYFQGNF